MTNKLFVLQGAPGCGKSTFIRNNSLEKYVVSPDEIRGLINPSPVIYSEEKRTVVNGYDFSPMTSSIAFDIALKIINTRMYRGQTIILDSTAGVRKTISKILEAARHWCYDVYYVDMMEGLSIEDILDRNAGRGSRAVPEDVVRRSYEKIKNYKYQKWEHKISQSEMLEMQYVRPENLMDKYDEIICIGDVQGCYDAFKKSQAYEAYKDPRVLTIFTGDLLDRGPKNHLMFDWACARMEEGCENVVFIRGNHDSYFRSFGRDDARLPRKTMASVEQILRYSRFVNGSKKRLRHYASRLYSIQRPCFAFKYGDDSDFLVTHGGLHPQIIKSVTRRGKYKLGFASDQDLYYGTGNTIDKGDYEIDIDYIISDLTGMLDTPVQIHGHRNKMKATYPNVPFEKGNDDFNDFVVNLEGRVETDGALRELIIKKNESPWTGYEFIGNEYREDHPVDWTDYDEARKTLGI